MKKIIYSLIFILAVLPIVSCSKDDPDENQSIIQVNSKSKNAFDKWLDNNYVLPYNIRFMYRMETIESDMNYTLVPAIMGYSIPMAHMVKYMCLEAYDEVAGVRFTRNYFPKQIHLIGSPAYNNNGTIVLGVAEGGKKITLYNINSLQTIFNNGVDAVNDYYFHTIHHEFSHILHQTKPYPASFSQISGSDYVSGNWSDEQFISGYLQRGFVSAYAQSSDDEDFAEMISIYITNTSAYWDNLLASAGAGAAKIKAKFDLIDTYMKKEWGIDLNTLREVIIRRENDVFSGKIDLNSVEIE